MSPRKGKKRKLEGPVESAQNPHSKASTSSAEQPAIAGETVDINFVFFSHSGPNSALPQSVSVPKDLLQRSLSICVPEFANALQRIFNFTAVRDVTFDFYEPTEKVLGSDFVKKDLPPDFRVTLLEEKFHLAARSMHLGALFDRAIQRKESEFEDVIVLGISAQEETTLKGGDGDSLGPSPLESYEKLLSEYAALQANPSTTIYNGRRAPDGPETVAPPIYMYHPIFSNFYKFLAEAPSQLTTDHLRKTQKFMTCAEVLWTEDEWLYHTTWKCLDEILGTAISEEDDPFSCGVEAVTVGGVRVRFLIAELERELLIGNNDSDPTTKVGLSFKRTWIQRDKSPIRELCNCPTFCLAGGGPWLCVLGGVLTKDSIVQPLTNMEWLACETNDDGFRIRKIACILWALRKALQELRTFYQGFNKPGTLQTRPKLTDSHPRFYPFVTSFSVDGQTITFAYLGHLKHHPTCLTFKAKITHIPNKRKSLPFQEGSQVVVKFASRYGTEIHQFLANLGFAPALYHVGNVSEWEWAVKPTFRQPPADLGIDFGCSFIVVMAFVETTSNVVNPPKELRAQQVARVLYHLHSTGFVIGDLQLPNIFFDGQRAKFVDFNWAGRFDPRKSEAKENLVGVPPLVQEKVKSLPSLSRGFAQFPVTVRSTLFEEEELALEPILPRHDWKRWRMCFPLDPDQEDRILRGLCK